MTKLIVYGDSFASSSYGPDNVGWTSLLANKLYATVYNRAIDGGSTENAMLKLVHDIRKNLIEDGDVIVFVLSTDGRLHFQFQKERPETACPYIHDVDTTDPKHQWYKENQEYIKWYIMNYDPLLNEMNHECYVHFLRNYAEHRPKVTVLVLANSKLYDSFPYVSTPRNFLKPPVSLIKMSDEEIQDNPSRKYEEWTKHTVYDTRFNHLSNPNLEVLANLCFESIQNNNVSNFTEDKFFKNVFPRNILNIEEYKKYCEQGILHYRSYMAQDMVGFNKDAVQTENINEVVVPPKKPVLKVLVERIVKLVRNVKKEYRYRRKLKNLRKSDPFIYK